MIYLGIYSLKMGTEPVMSFIDAIFTLIFGICLPSWDVYSDFVSAFTLIIPRCYDYKAYHYYEKYHNWTVKCCSSTTVSNCTTSINYHKWVKFVQCPETKKCIEELDICDRFEFDDCGDGSDENFCNDYRILQNKSKMNPFDEELCIAGGGKFYGHPKIGIAMLSPVLLSMGFILIQWWNNEKKTSLKNKIGSLTLVLLQLYPQWQMLKVLRTGLWNKNIIWKKEKEIIQLNMGGIEPVLESVPQVYILLIIWGMYPTLINLNFFPVAIFSSRNTSITDLLYLTTFFTSVISASKGMADFLTNGPCKLVPNMSFGYILLCVNILITFFGKGMLIVVALFNNGSPTSVGVYWLCFNAFPQLLLELVAILATCGLKHGCKVIMSYPALIVTPMFSLWTFGPIIRFSCDPCFCSGVLKIEVSAKLTWCNILLSFAGAFGFCRVLNLSLPYDIPLSIMFALIVLVLLIQTLDYSKCFCGCSVCIIHCYPVTKLTSLDPITMEIQVNQDINVNQLNQQEMVAFEDVIISNCDVLF